MDLLDLHLAGRQFTWVDLLCSKMAKVDRFLVSNGAMYWFYNINGVFLDRLWSDHSLIVLNNEEVEYV